MVRSVFVQVALIVGLLICVPIGSATEPEYRSYTYATAGALVTAGIEESGAGSATLGGGQVVGIDTAEGATIAAAIDDLGGERIAGWWAAYETHPSPGGRTFTLVERGSFCSAFTDIMPSNADHVKIGVEIDTAACGGYLTVPTAGTLHVWVG